MRFQTTAIALALCLSTPVVYASGTFDVNPNRWEEKNGKFSVGAKSLKTGKRVPFNKLMLGISKIRLNDYSDPVPLVLFFLTQLAECQDPANWYSRSKKMFNPVNWKINDIDLRVTGQCNDKGVFVVVPETLRNNDIIIDELTKYSEVKLSLDMAEDFYVSGAGFHLAHWAVANDVFE